MHKKNGYSAHRPDDELPYLRLVCYDMPRGERIINTAPCTTFDEAAPHAACESRPNGKTLLL